MDARISLLFLSILVTISTIAKQQNVSVIESFLKAQLMWFYSMSSINLPRTWDWIFWLLDCQTKTDEYIDKFPICESQEAMENLVEKRDCFVTSLPAGGQTDKTKW